MFTVMLFTSVVYVSNELGIALVDDVKLAMKRADLTLDYTARVTGTPMQRLSDQLNGKAPFTAFCRFYYSQELREETDFWVEFYALQARRIDRMCVRADVGALVQRLETVLEVLPKVMAKADLLLARTGRKEAC